MVTAQNVNTYIQHTLLFNVKFCKCNIKKIYKYRVNYLLDAPLPVESSSDNTSSSVECNSGNKSLYLRDNVS